MPPTNDALRFQPRRWYRIHLTCGSVVQGRCTFAAPDRVVVTSSAGHFSCWTGEVARVDNGGSS